MTLQTIFDRMMLLDNQLDLAAGGDDVTRGLTTLNMVADWLESEAATMEKVLQRHDLLYTAANTETSDWPARLLRLDELWLVDSDTGRPTFRLDPIQDTGGHRPGFLWPLSELILSATPATALGPPREYAASGPGGQFYWAPEPDDEYWIRAYGLWEVEDFVSADDLFPFPNTLAVSFPAMATHTLRLGLDRDLAAIGDFVKATFRPALKGLKRPNHSDPISRVYTEVHDA